MRIVIVSVFSFLRDDDETLFTEINTRQQELINLWPSTMQFKLQY